MTIPYTYLIKCNPTNQYYYGVRYAKNCNPSDLWVNYFTSSTMVKVLIKRYGKDAFSIDIRRTFQCARDALIWEEKVLHRMKVLTDMRCINANIGGHMFRSTKSSSDKGAKTRTGRHHTIDHCNHISKSTTGIKKTLTLEQRYNLSQRCIHTPLSKGVSRTTEFKQKLSADAKNRIWVNNNITSKRILYTEINEYINTGWTRGRIGDSTGSSNNNYGKGRKVIIDNIIYPSMRIAGDKYHITIDLVSYRCKSKLPQWNMWQYV